MSNPLYDHFYQVEPKDKSLDRCRSHGDDHQAYNMSKKIDPRWSDEQKAAYLEGYEGNAS